MNEPSGEGRFPSPVLVGVCHNQHPEVVATAARLAAAMGQSLICAYAVTGLESSEWKVKGVLDFETLDADERQEIGAEAILELRDTLGTALKDSPVAWSLRIKVGEPASALEEFATLLGSSLLVIGSPRRRRFGFTSARMRSSTLARLLSHRKVPVLVVPPRIASGLPDTDYLP